MRGPRRAASPTLAAGYAAALCQRGITACWPPNAVQWMPHSAPTGDMQGPHPVDLRPREELGVAAGAEQDEVSGGTRGDAAGVAQLHGGRGHGSDGGGPGGDGAIEVAEAHALCEHLQHVEVAVLVELVARVVTRERHRHAGGLQLLQRRDAPPPRRPPHAGAAVLHTPPQVCGLAGSLLPHCLTAGPPMRTRASPRFPLTACGMCGSRVDSASQRAARAEADPRAAVPRVVLCKETVAGACGRGRHTCVHSFTRGRETTTTCARAATASVFFRSAGDWAARELHACISG